MNINADRLISSAFLMGCTGALGGHIILGPKGAATHGAVFLASVSTLGLGIEFIAQKIFTKEGPDFAPLTARIVSIALSIVVVTDSARHFGALPSKITLPIAKGIELATGTWVFVAAATICCGLCSTVFFNVKYPIKSNFPMKANFYRSWPSFLLMNKSTYF